MSKIPLIVVAGPTASGKTGLAIDLARRFNGEIIGADSMQIYKHMDIGTAKPTEKERAAAVHHLIDFVSPKERFSAADYAALAHEVIADITNRGRIPIMAGGTGLYIDSVINDVEFPKGESDASVREYYFGIAREQGGEKLLEILAEFDPKSAAQLHPNNVKRIVRAIEFYKLTGTTMSDHREEIAHRESRYETLMLIPSWDREILYERINARVDKMVEVGLENEVRNLMAHGCKTELNSMQAIGYKEMAAYINSECTLEEAVLKIKQNSRNYAKRQITWFKREKCAVYIDANADMESEAVKTAERFLKGYRGF